MLVLFGFPGAKSSVASLLNSRGGVFANFSLWAKLELLSRGLLSVVASCAPWPQPLRTRRKASRRTLLGGEEL